MILSNLFAKASRKLHALLQATIFIGLRIKKERNTFLNSSMDVTCYIYKKIITCVNYYEVKYNIYTR